MNTLGMCFSVAGAFEDWKAEVRLATRAVWSESRPLNVRLDAWPRNEVSKLPFIPCRHWFIVAKRHHRALLTDMFTGAKAGEFA